MDVYDDKWELSDCFSWAMQYEDLLEPRLYPHVQATGKNYGQQFNIG